MTTIDPMVPDGIGTFPAPPPPRRRWLLPTLSIVVIVLAIAYLVANHYTANYYAIAPGDAQPAQNYISVPPDKLHKHKGQLLIVTVSLFTVRPFSWIGDKLNSDIQILKVQDITGNTPPSQLNALDAVQMQNSTQTAVIVALRRLGYTVNLNGEGAEVDAVVANSPAANILIPGDVIVSFDGEPVLSNDTLVAAIQKHHVGDRVTFQVQEGAPPRTVTKTVVLGQQPAPATPSPTKSPTTPQTKKATTSAPTTQPAPTTSFPPKPFLGIQVTTKEQPNLPIDVKINPGNIGGPSAGLSFTLGIIDDLSNGDVTGGKTIAVTGTINADGTVGDVGGVAQKAVAVRKAGAVAFLVPRGELKVAQQHAGPHVKVIEVTTLEQALTALRSLGGDVSGLPPPPAQLDS